MSTENKRTTAAAAAAMERQPSSSRHQCEVCGLTYERRWHLTVHQRERHADEWRYTCAACGKGFRCKQKLTGHCASHTGERPFACRACGKRFLRADTLTWHVRLKHSEAERHACDRCDKEFARAVSLSRHVRRVHRGTHTVARRATDPSEKPQRSDAARVACDRCGKRFTRLDNLKRHVRQRHSAAGDHACDKCGKRYTRNDALRRHIGQAHAETAAPCTPLRVRDPLNRGGIKEKLGLVSTPKENQVDSSTEIVGIKSDVRENISKKYNKNITPAALRVRDPLNRGGIKEKLGLVSTPKENQVDSSTVFSCTDDDESVINDLKFSFTFSDNERQSIKPKNQTYEENHGPRTYQIMSPYEWTNILQKHFFTHTRLPCCLVFKKTFVNINYGTSISVRGHCSDCGSVFEASIKQIPDNDSRVIMDCKYSGCSWTYDISHSNKMKLMGSPKMYAVTEMLDKNIDPSVSNRREATRLMRDGDSVPVQIPNNQTLRTAKSRAINAERLHSNPIDAINIMKRCESYSSIIRNVGYDGFFVHFWSNLQLQIYNESHSIVKIPTMSFDATGGCCKKIKRSNGDHSNTLFLYEGVMEIQGKTFTALSMISEQHDTLSIYTWLNRWLRCGIKPPKMIVSDQSLALMSAIVQSFTQYKSLQEYLEACYKLIFNTKNKANSIPTCYVRNDVNHFINLITKWTPLKNIKFPRTKSLYVRSMALLIYCNSIEEANKILRAIFCVALSQSDGHLLISNTQSTEDTLCASSKKYLQSLISNKMSYLQVYDSFIDENSTDKVLYEDHNLEDQCDDFFGSFEIWALSIADKCKIEVETNQGEIDNAQYTPEIVPLIIKAMKLYPCWSGIMRTTFGFGEASVSSARIESNFNQLKNRVFKSDNLPLRVDTFLDKIISYYKGDHLLIQNNIPSIKINDTNIILTNQLSASDNKCQEINPENGQVDKVHIDTITLDDNYLSTYICSNTVNNKLDENINESKQVDEETSGILHSCAPYSNGDFPTGAHCCAQCSKPVNLFDCLVKNIDSEEGYGETRICLTCAEYNKEIGAKEQWQKTRKSTTLETRRSAKSYLNPQEGFEHLNFNIKGSEKEVVFLKNGNTFNNEPQTIKNMGKVILRNTCSVDSLLTSLAYAAAESSNYFSFLLKHEKCDLTAKFIFKMLSKTNLKKTNLYKERIELLAPHFPFEKYTALSNIQLIDVMGTLTCMATKLFSNMPSYTKVNSCSNELCSNFMIVHEYPVLSLCAFDGNLNLQEEIDRYFSEEETECVECPSIRKHTVNAKSHLMIELVSLPKELEASTSYGNIMEISNVPQNYANTILWNLDEIPKKLQIKKQEYYLRSAIVFINGDRTGRKVSTGHYISVVWHANGRWKVYDDLKETATNPHRNKQNVEFLVYTI